MPPNTCPLAISTSTSPHLHLAMATATGISPVSSPLGTGGSHAGHHHHHHHHHTHRRLPRTTSVTSSPQPQATSSPGARGHATSQQQQQQQQQHQISSTGQSATSSVTPRPTNPIRQQLATTTPAAQIAAHSAGGFPSFLVDSTEGNSPNYFNLSFSSNDGTSSKGLPNAGLSNASSGAGGLGANHLPLHARSNFSPPSSRVRSTAAASPRVMPVDQNPEFEAFKRQSELRGQRAVQSGFGFLGGPSDDSSGPGGAQAASSKLKNVQSQQSEAETHTKPAPLTSLGQHLHEGVPRSPKRALHSPYPNLTDRPRRLSPAGFTEREASGMPLGLVAHKLSVDAAFSLPASTALGLGAFTGAKPRSDTVPEFASGQRRHESASDEGHPFYSPSHIVTLLEACDDEILVIDLRVQHQYSRSRIRGALNICIPPLLLKRPVYDTERLAASLTNPDEKRRFEKWRSCKYIIVYDANSSKHRDAVTCLSMLKKFENEGWAGSQAGHGLVVRGGFEHFARLFPTWVVHEPPARPSSSSNSSSSSLAGAMLLAPHEPTTSDTGQIGGAFSNNMTLPAIVGGCPMPPAVTRNPANPFFGNIRQNMDLIGGVGQMDIKLPTAMLRRPALFDTEVPSWLRSAAEREDHGERVAAGFLAIERDEQRRMQDALSGKVRYDATGHATPGGQASSSTSASASTTKQQGTAPVQLAGIEKGSKNRYNNIWPYEHTRVKLENVCAGDCDYINANHIRPRWSNKRYIATQGPIPSTFADFWNVVWQQDVRVIVMLTAESEGGQIKAHNYWSQRRYGPLRLDFLAEKRASLEPGRIRGRRGLGGSELRSPTVAQAPGKRREQDGTPGSPRDTRGRKGMGSPAQQHAGGASSYMSASSGGTFFPPASKQKQFTPTEPARSAESSKDEQPYVIVRRFTLSSDAEPFARMREITHLQYSHWPDFGAPAHPAHLLGLVEQCEAVVRAGGVQSPTTTAVASMGGLMGSPRTISGGIGGIGGRGGGDRGQAGREPELPAEAGARPVLVHCSAGCGRTGTFCTVDSVIDMMRRQGVRAGEREADVRRNGEIGGGKGLGIGGEMMDVEMAESQGTATLDSGLDKSFGGDDVAMTDSSPPPPLSAAAADPVRENEWVASSDVDLIERTVADFRLQRLSMVQSLRQYVLCYETVLEWIAERDGGSG